MKNVVAIFILTFCLSLAVHAQQDTALFLKEPAAWQFLRFVNPMVVTELRYSPGMFKSDAPDYFTHVMVARVDSTTTFSQDDISEYLGNYFKAICSDVEYNSTLPSPTPDKGMPIDGSACK